MFTKGVTLRFSRSTFLALLLISENWATYVASENEVIAKPRCDSSASVNIRYASSTERRLYLEPATFYDQDACVTLTDIFNDRGDQGPLYPVDPSAGTRVSTATGTWILTEDLYVGDFVTLNVHGGPDGDCDELRLLSDSSTLINLRAESGQLSFHDTKVFAWDEKKNSYDTDYEDGRSYISAISEVPVQPYEYTELAVEVGEARMDIVNSEMAYLGYNAAESYGLVWKVRGLCLVSEDPKTFKGVYAYGNIYNSEIHHTYLGTYTCGRQQGALGDITRANIKYGSIPHDDSASLNIPDSTVYGNAKHSIITSERCSGPSTQGNTVHGPSQVGVFLDRGADDGIVAVNVNHGPFEGIQVLESYPVEVYIPPFTDSSFGVRLSARCEKNWFLDGEFIQDSTWDSKRLQDNELSKTKMEGGSETIKLQDSDYTVLKE